MTMAFATGPVFSTTGSTVGTIDVRPWKSIVLDVDLSATTETLSVKGSTDNKNFNAAALRPTDMGTGALAAASTFKDGIYKLDVSALAAVAITKSATTESVTVRTGLGL